jgi:hypothetical protein
MSKYLLSDLAFAKDPTKTPKTGMARMIRSNRPKRFKAISPQSGAEQVNHQGKKEL